MTTKNLRDGVLVIKDGTTPTPNEIEVVLDEGDLTFTETNNLINVMDRGSLSHRRNGDETPVSLSFTIKYQELYKQTTDSTPTVYEALKKIGGASAWVTTDACGSPYSVLLEFTINDPCSTKEDEVITFDKFTHTTFEFSEGDEYNTLSINGEAFITEPTITKS